MWNLRNAQSRARETPQAIRQLSAEQRVARKMSSAPRSSSGRIKRLMQSNADQRTPSDDDLSKTVLLGALTAETTEEMIESHLGKWGALHSVVVIRDEITGRSERDNAQTPRDRVP